MDQQGDTEMAAEGGGQEAEMFQREKQARTLLLREEDIGDGLEWQNSLSGMLKAEPHVVVEEIHLLEGLPSTFLLLCSQ
jgi:hypothetical protein